MTFADSQIVAQSLQSNTGFLQFKKLPIVGAQQKLNVGQLSGETDKPGNDGFVGGSCRGAAASSSGS